MTAPGLLIDGNLVDVPGVTVIPPASQGGPAWNQLHPDDYAARRLSVNLIVLHTTGGRWPQPIIEEPRPGGHAREVLEMWSGADRGGGDRVHSGAQITVDHDGTGCCSVDVVRCAAYHATAVNGRAIGLEMCTYPDGSITRACLRSAAAIVAVLCDRLGIPRQMPRGPYRNAPLRRLESGGVQSDGADLVGVIGHRDQTAQRGYGDPGNAIWGELAALGFVGVDYDGREDIELGKGRQRWLNAEHARLGLTWAPLVVDGVLGAASRAAMRRVGGSWAAVDRAVAAATAG